MEKLLLALFVVLIGPVWSRAAEVAWRTSYAAARKESTETGKPLLFYFTQPHCVVCTRLQASLAEQANKINLDFVPFKITAPAWPTDAMKVTSTPTLIFAKPDGTVVKRLVDYQDSVQLGTVLDSIQRRRPESSGPQRAAANPCPPMCPCQGKCQCKETGQSCAATGKGCFPMGLGQDHLALTPTRYVGQRATPAEALEGAEQITDVSGLRWLPVFHKADKAEEAARICDAINAAAGRYVRCQPFPDTVFQAQGFKLHDDKEFQKTGLIGLLQDPPTRPGGLGKMLETAHDADDIIALGRKQDPNFDINKKPTGPNVSGLLPGLILIGAGALGLCFVGAFLFFLPNAVTEEESDELLYAA